MTVHHAVFDGWSQAMLYDDLAAAYAGRSPAGRRRCRRCRRVRRLRGLAGRAATDRRGRGRPGLVDRRTWTARRPCWSCPATGPARRCRPTPARRRRVARPPATDRAVRELAATGAHPVAAVLLAAFG